MATGIYVGGCSGVLFMAGQVGLWLGNVASSSPPGIGQTPRPGLLRRSNRRRTRKFENPEHTVSRQGSGITSFEGQVEWLQRDPLPSCVGRAVLRTKYPSGPTIKSQLWRQALRNKDNPTSVLGLLPMVRGHGHSLQRGGGDRKSIRGSLHVITERHLRFGLPKKSPCQKWVCGCSFCRPRQPVDSPEPGGCCDPSAPLNASWAARCAGAAFHGH